MKKGNLSFLIYFLFIGMLFSQETVSELAVDNSKATWEVSFKDALKRSKKENKPVLIYFTGSDWCGPCKILDRNLFHSEKFKEISEKDLILYEANNPRNKDLVAYERLQENYKLISDYSIKSYPTLVFVNDKGKMIGHKKGLVLTEYYYPFIQSVIENY